ncbi:MAG: tryptophan-rich sensory protein [Gemmatimonadaceae bacterium]|nr:tryptophan-rich sensory protein [Gemmatimonadaceae bacterium]
MFGFSATAIALAAGGLVVTAAGGALVTQLGPWYYGLKKPAWQPPDWLFGPAWTTIFLCMGVAFVLSWEQLPDTGDKVRLFGLFALNGGLNTLWSFLFFGRRRPDLALIEIVPFFSSIVLLTLTVAPLDRRAAWAFVPYLCWVLFATVLNISIVRRNAPFGTR